MSIYKNLNLSDLDNIFKKYNVDNDNINEIVKNIIKDVKLNKDEALIKYTKKFDNVDISNFLVTEEEINEAYNSTSKSFIKVLELARKRIENYHKLQVQKNTFKNDENGIILGQIITPIEKVGLYVPGGTASYPSTVLMNSIPAKIAGVKELIMVTPPNKENKISKEVLSAAKIAGVDKIYKVGGAQAIAALAYGTNQIPKVDKIVGPGNIFVATAKKLVFGDVNIDMIAGPSEVLIILDDSARIKFVAADLLAQLEHDKLAKGIAICKDEETAIEIEKEVYKQFEKLKRKDILNESIKNNLIIIIEPDINKAIEFSNYIAPEHLELCIYDPAAYLNQVKNAGSIFLGNYTPEVLGDYLSGTNHTLPTNKTARFSSALSVDDFIKKSSVSYFTKDALKRFKNELEEFALVEGLDAHKNSASIRFEDENE